MKYLTPDEIKKLWPNIDWRIRIMASGAFKLKGWVYINEQAIPLKIKLFAMVSEPYLDELYREMFAYIERVWHGDLAPGNEYFLTEEAEEILMQTLMKGKIAIRRSRALNKFLKEIASLE